MRSSALLCKVFLLHLTDLLDLDAFPNLWLQLLKCLQKLMEQGSDSLVT